MIKGRTKKVISSILLSALIVQTVPIPAFAGYTNPYEIDTAKMQDVLQSEGTVIGVYEPYHGTFKLIHYFKGMGVPNPDVEKLSNTYCVGNADSHYEVLIDTNLKYQGGGSCSVYTGINNDLPYGVYQKCRTGNQEIVYNTQTGNIVSVAKLYGRLCQRYVNLDYIRKYLKDINVNDMISAGKWEGVARDLGSAKETYLANMTEDEAIALMTSYMRQNNISTGIFSRETFYTRTEKKGKIRKKIITHFYENPTYHLIIKGVNAGVPLGNGYFLLKEGEGLNLVKNNIEIHTITKSGWSFIASVLISVALGVATAGIGSAIGVGLGLMSAYSVSFWAVAGYGALGGLAGFGASWAVNGFGTDDVLDLYGVGGGWKEKHPTTGDGADQLASRVRSGSDMDVNLSAYYENSYTKTSYSNMTKAGGFTDDKKQKRVENFAPYTY